VDQGEPTSTRPTVCLDPARLLLATCRLAGLTGEKLATVAKDAILESLENAAVPEEQQLTLDLLASLLNQLKDNAAAALPPSRCEGICEVTGMVELLSFQPE